MRGLLIAVLVAACGDAQLDEATAAGQPAAEALRSAPSVGSIVERTQQVIDEAQRKVPHTGDTAEKFRGAWMRQEAAKKADSLGETKLAVKFSLHGRRLARKALVASGVPFDEARAVIDPEEKALYEGVDDDEYDRWMERYDSQTPPAAELLGAAQAEVTPQAQKILDRSQAVLDLAREAARTGGREKNKYRGAWMRQQAGVRALQDGRPRMAAKFGLQVRKLAFKVIVGNGGTEDPKLVETVAEKAVKLPVEDAPDAEYDLMLAAIEKTAPSIEELLK